ncbi:hypothetical protein [Brachybacterium sp. GPGPB12]|uniref:hypothetical protein n=1 Tax=Brachybacterium sp. GPGPB12 TaxID=3023517 RepID=UPI0031344469
MLSRPVLLDDGEIRGADGGAPEVLGPTVEVLGELVASGPALEVASGTGGVATRLYEAVGFHRAHVYATPEKPVG